MDSSFRTQRDVDATIIRELGAAGFASAEEIGRGGFGIVFRCEQVALDRTVAVKVLTTELPEDRERFLREQRAMGRLTGHPNIVGVLQVGETASGYPYLVMQYHQKGSLQARIQRLGRLPLSEVLRVGVKVAGALETAHRLEILHRDIKPANILLTDFGEPVLCDFGIAHIADGFKTATGTFTGSPSFTAPEILSGDPPTPASDVYGLGATLFAALTGHAAYERRSGEQVVAQFLRITTDPIPDLRDSQVSDDIATVIEQAMARDPQERPSAALLGERLLRVQASHGLGRDEVPLRSERPAPDAASLAAGGYAGFLPAELTSFFGRQAELTEIATLLATSRLVTAVGIGGVGKTRLALRAASEMRRDFPEGVWFVELGDVRDSALVANAVVDRLGLRDESGRSQREVLIEFLGARRAALVLDNCEHVIDEAAKLADALLRGCPNLRVLATSRERLGIAGEAVLNVSPLPLPDADCDPTLRSLLRYDAVALFVERAAAVVPGFALTEENKVAVARICSQVDGLPLAIELTAARLRALSLDQILGRLVDRFQLLTRGLRGAPTRQQTLSCSVDWSYDLCTSAEQRLWARLSVFAGSFDLEAAEDICNGDLAPENVVDLLTSLADKSIVVPVGVDGMVRFRFLETLRVYGQNKLIELGEYTEFRRRHLQWYRRLVTDAAANWFSSQQLTLIKRIELDAPNWREALAFALIETPQTVLEMAAGLSYYANARGAFSEMRSWLDRALTATPSEPSEARIEALFNATVMTSYQGDISGAATRADEARALDALMANPISHGWAALAQAAVALFSGDWGRVVTLTEDALASTDNPMAQVTAIMIGGTARERLGDVEPALAFQERALHMAESAGELMFRSYALWSIGIGWWRYGKNDRAEALLRQCLEVAEQMNDPRNGAAALEAMAWILGARNNLRQATVLMAAADAQSNRIGVSPAVLPDLIEFHDECQRRARDVLSEEEFDAAWQLGVTMDLAEAVAYTLNVVPPIEEWPPSLGR